MRRLKIRLARNAPAVQACPPELVTLDHRHVHSKLGGADRTDVAARSTAQKHHMETLFRQTSSPFASGPTRCRASKSLEEGKHRVFQQSPQRRQEVGALRAVDNRLVAG